MYPTTSQSYSLNAPRLASPKQVEEPLRRVDSWAREQALRVVGHTHQRPQVSAPATQPHAADLTQAQACDIWRANKRNVQAMVGKCVPALPSRPAPQAPKPRFLLTPPVPTRPLPPVPPQKRPICWTDASHLIASPVSDTHPNILWPPQRPAAQPLQTPPSPPLTRAATEVSVQGLSPRLRAESLSDASFYSSTPSFSAPSELSWTAHTDDGKPAVIIGQDILVGGEQYPLRTSRRGLVTYYNPLRGRQIVVHFDDH